MDETEASNTLGWLRKFFVVVNLVLGSLATLSVVAEQRLLRQVMQATNMEAMMFTTFSASLGASVILPFLVVAAAASLVPKKRRPSTAVTVQASLFAVGAVYIVAYSCLAWLPLLRNLE